MAHAPDRASGWRRRAPAHSTWLVHYCGAAPGLVDLLSGQVQIFLAAANTALPQVRGGKLRTLNISLE